MKVTVLGAGAWGTALAKVLAEGGHAITLWGHDAKRLEEVKRSGRNERYLPGVELPKNLQFEADVTEAVQGSEFVVAAVPSKAFRDVTSRMPDYAGVVVSVTKGIEYESGLTMCGILAETAPKAKAAAVSGPTFALEVAKGIP